MPSNKKLPILKLLLLPVLSGIGYGAYCYYSELHQQKLHKIHAPIRYMQELHKILQQSESTPEMERVYGLMARHMDVFVVDPTSKDERLTDSKVVREVQSEFGVSSRFKVVKEFDVNYFNVRNEKKSGKFTLGLWSDLSEIKINSLKLADPMINLAEKSLKMRQKKCKNIADLASKNLERGYLEQYIQCIGCTEGSASALQRQIDLARKMMKYQPNIQ